MEFQKQRDYYRHNKFCADSKALDGTLVILLIKTADSTFSTTSSLCVVTKDSRTELEPFGAYHLCFARGWINATVETTRSVEVSSLNLAKIMVL